MRNLNRPRAGLAAVAILALAARTAAADPQPASPMPDNPFFSESTLPFHLPPFDRIKDSDYTPAFERGMADQLKEDDAIAANPDKPTFDNTIVAMERSGRILARVSSVFFNLKDANGDAEMRKIDTAMAPRLSAHNDAIYLNAALFARVQAVFDQRSALSLDPESLRLLERYHRDFVRAGARLSDADKSHLRDLNAQIASLESTFRQNVLAEKNASSIVVHDRAELAGLSDSEIASLQQAAVEEKKPGEYVIRIVNTTGQPDLASLENRALRERIMEKSLGRGSSGGPFDNQATVVQLARKRAERATLLGYESHAAYQVEIGTARTVAAVDELLGKLVPPAVAKAKREAADMQAVIDQDHGGFQLASWDWDFYSEKVRTARYSFDESQLKPYFELNRVLVDGVFFAAHQLYGITFKERHDLPVYQPDVRVFEVYDKDGSPLAILLEDFYARPSKIGGAWMNEYVSQSGLFGDSPVVGNHHNIPKPAPGEPTLLTFDEVTTLFHEFGHGLHGMFSHVKYPLFAGTNVARDFVEYPSQVNEMWAAWPEVVRNYAKHYKTGEPMPIDLLNKMLATRKFNQGFATTEYLKAVLEDQAWHTLKADQVPSDVAAFETATFKKNGADFAPVPPRYRSTYFSHVFASEEYSADYFSYIWADVLVADSIEWFANHGGLTRANGDHFRATVLSNGGSIEAMTLFGEFTGGGPEIGPLLRHRGLDESGN
jgi:peptidyl-dipeptidase Dcp